MKNFETFLSEKQIIVNKGIFYYKYVN